jgi:hypothetical protein
MQVALYQSGTLIAQTPVTSITRGSFNTYSYTLTSGEAAAITDYADLRVRLVASTLGGGDQLDLAWAELEVPGQSGSKSPTISRDTSTGDLYVFYIGSNSQVKGRKYSAAWTFAMRDVDLSTSSKDYITSPYTVSPASAGVWAWGQGGSSPYEVKIARIPEFGEMVVPVVGTLLLLGGLRASVRKGRRRKGDAPQNQSGARRSQDT